MKVRKLKWFFDIYRDGFREMSWSGRKLWLIILVKLFILFAVFKLFLFPDFLKSRYKNNADRSNYVIEQLTQTKK